MVTPPTIHDPLQLSAETLGINLVKAAVFSLVKRGWAFLFKGLTEWTMSYFYPIWVPIHSNVIRIWRGWDVELGGQGRHGREYTRGYRRKV
jgi:hypothetical protein